MKKTFLIANILFLLTIVLVGVSSQQKCQHDSAECAQEGFTKLCDTPPCKTASKVFDLILLGMIVNEVLLILKAFLAYKNNSFSHSKKRFILLIILIILLLIIIGIASIIGSINLCTADMREMCNPKTGEKWVGSSHCDNLLGITSGADKLTERGWVDCLHLEK
ncbi:MAG: hypothetical protein V1867_07075 [Candidatus Falkowbacteria bacterium]